MKCFKDQNSVYIDDLDKVRLVSYFIQKAVANYKIIKKEKLSTPIWNLCRNTKTRTTYYTNSLVKITNGLLMLAESGLTILLLLHVRTAFYPNLTKFFWTDKLPLTLVVPPLPGLPVQRSQTERTPWRLSYLWRLSPNATASLSSYL